MKFASVVVMAAIGHGTVDAFSVPVGVSKRIVQSRPPAGVTRGGGSGSSALDRMPSSPSALSMVAGMEDNEDFLDALTPFKKGELHEQGANQNPHAGSGGSSENTDGPSVVGDEQEEKDEVGSGSSRFKALMEAAKQGGSAAAAGVGGRAIENPFLNPSTSNPSPSVPTTTSTDPNEMSVEEQARLFREMMANKGQGGGGGSTVAPPPPAVVPQVQRVAKTDRPSRPVQIGRAHV